MKKPNLFLTAMFFSFVLITSCDESKPKESELTTKDLENTTINSKLEGEEKENPIEINSKVEGEENENPTEEAKEAIHYESYNYNKKFKEEALEKGPSDILDFRNRDNDKFIGIKFADGQSGTIVFREGYFYNYTIREKTEVRFATKEDGLQRIWDDSRLLQDAGAAIGSFITKKAGPRKNDGTLDKRYNENK